MCDDLHFLSEELHKESGFGTGIVGVPGRSRSSRSCRQADVALRSHAMTEQECRITRLRSDQAGSRWRRNPLRYRRADATERRCEGEGGCEQAPGPHNIVDLFTNVVAHFLL